MTCITIATLDVFAFHAEWCPLSIVFLLLIIRSLSHLCLGLPVAPRVDWAMAPSPAYLAVSGNGLVGFIPIIGPISADMTP